MTHEWCAKGVEPTIDEMQNLKISDLPNWESRLNAGEAIVSMGWNAEKEKTPEEFKIFDGQDIHALIEIPIFSNNKLNGYIGFDNPEQTKTALSVRLLTAVGGHIGGLKENLHMMAQLEEKQILQNIAGNAVKYNRQGGSIEFTCEEIECKDGIATYRFVCKDTGIGMSEEFIPHVFEPFAQEEQSARTSYMGTGLGLAIVKQLVEMMDGQIEMESKLNEGTIFTINLPFKIDQSYEEEETGFFDLILMDIMMPVMDGLEATKQIRALSRKDAKEIPIIAMTCAECPEE